MAAASSPATPGGKAVITSSALHIAAELGGGKLLGQAGGETEPKTTSMGPLSRLRDIPPKGTAVAYMAMGMALHFGGYEFARSSSLALFTSSSSGFSSPGAFPLAMACASPMSVLLLMGYGAELEKNGPRIALRYTTIFSMLALTLSSALITILERYHIALRLPRVLGAWVSDGGDMIPLSKLIVWLYFVFQNSYAHLLYTQQWSFIGSVLTPTQGSSYFASIAGLSSITSTAAGTSVSWVVEKVGISGLLGGTVICLLLSMICGDVAYGISEKYGFDPAEEIKKKKKEKDKKKVRDSSSPGAVENEGMVRKATDLFVRVPTLWYLFCEVLSFQSLSTLVNVCFVTKLKSAIIDDSARAAWTGKLFAAINAVSGILQFGVLPLLMKRVEPRWVWRLMPIIPVVCTFFTSFQKDPSLTLLAFSFFAAKVIDYSFRNVVNEMVYVPLDFESRYLGKEVIGVFGSRFGKSGMSLLLSSLSYLFGNFGIVELSRFAALVSLSWLGCSCKLSNLIPKQADAEEAVAKRNLENKKRQ